MRPWLDPMLKKNMKYIIHVGCEDITRRLTKRPEHKNSSCWLRIQGQEETYTAEKHSYFLKSYQFEIGPDRNRDETERKF